MSGEMTLTRWIAGEVEAERAVVNSGEPGEVEKALASIETLERVSAKLASLTATEDHPVSQGEERERKILSSFEVRQLLNSSGEEHTARVADLQKRLDRAGLGWPSGGNDCELVLRITPDSNQKGLS